MFSNEISPNMHTFCAAPLRAPKWYKRPVGASFGFGGKLVSFHPKSPAGGVSEVILLHVACAFKFD